MHIPSQSHTQIFRLLLCLLFIGTLLSACGRNAQSATREDSATSVTTTVVPVATAAQLAAVTVDGVIEQMAQERWLVGGTSILLDAQTTISGAPALGGSARIRGVMSVGGAVRAQTIIVDTLTQPGSGLASPTIAPTTVPTAVPTPAPFATGNSRQH